MNSEKSHNSPPAIQKDRNHSVAQFMAEGPRNREIIRQSSTHYETEAWEPLSPREGIGESAACAGV